MDVLDDLSNIANYYGLEPQLAQTAEEAAELAQAALKYRKAALNPFFSISKNIKEKSNLIEEIADVYVMISQIALLLDSIDDVNRVASEKINRQIERIKQEKQVAQANDEKSQG